MRRIVMMWTCPAVLPAIAALGAAAAAAEGTPEWYECVKAKGVGT
jgi:hypothetical protein